VPCRRSFGLSAKSRSSINPGWISTELPIDMLIQGIRSELNVHEVNGAGDSNALTETECLDGSIWVKMA
jgi:hypothetical protein